MSKAISMRRPSSQLRAPSPRLTEGVREFGKNVLVIGGAALVGIGLYHLSAPEEGATKPLPAVCKVQDRKSVV